MSHVKSYAFYKQDTKVVKQMLEAGAEPYLGVMARHYVAKSAEVHIPGLRISLKGAQPAERLSWKSWPPGCLLKKLLQGLVSLLCNWQCWSSSPEQALYCHL